MASTDSLWHVGGRIHKMGRQSDSSMRDIKEGARWMENVSSFVDLFHYISHWHPVLFLLPIPNVKVSTIIMD